MRVTHVLLLHDPARAEALAAAVAAAGYESRIDTHDGGFTWIVSGVGSVDDAARFVAFAGEYGAEYEGSTADPVG